MSISPDIMRYKVVKLIRRSCKDFALYIKEIVCGDVHKLTSVVAIVYAID